MEMVRRSDKYQIKEQTKMLKKHLLLLLLLLHVGGSTTTHFLLFCTLTKAFA